MTTRSKAPRDPLPETATNLTAEERLRCYTPDEVVELKLLRVSARWLKDMAYKRAIPHTKVAGRIAFRLDHIAAISAAGDEPVIAFGRRAA
ncbi:hypothetical protein [Streptacidiphilus sp. MAP5-3]|uniref:hypothetical protein n=1 Tax=unclassified Streptacidiphilus TaxID=2643834 RepID=UPI003516747D